MHLERPGQDGVKNATYLAEIVADRFHGHFNSLVANLCIRKMKILVHENFFYDIEDIFF